MHQTAAWVVMTCSCDLVALQTESLCQVSFIRFTVNFNLC